MYVQVRPVMCGSRWTLICVGEYDKSVNVICFGLKRLDTCVVCGRGMLLSGVLLKYARLYSVVRIGC